MLVFGRLRRSVGGCLPPSGYTLNSPCASPPATLTISGWQIGSQEELYNLVGSIDVFNPFGADANPEARNPYKNRWARERATNTVLRFAVRLGPRRAGGRFLPAFGLQAAVRALARWADCRDRWSLGRLDRRKFRVDLALRAQRPCLALSSPPQKCSAGPPSPAHPRKPCKKTSDSEGRRYKDWGVEDFCGGLLGGAPPLSELRVAGDLRKLGILL